jgi:hypothetical protein
VLRQVSFGVSIIFFYDFGIINNRDVNKTKV